MRNTVAFLACFLVVIPAIGVARGVSGEFDYYVLSLSWSPQYCASQTQQASAEQCGADKHYGFILHGLWPEYEIGWPEYCDALPQDVPQEIVDRILPITPASSLIEHEWDKHGKCSGLTVEDYFAAGETTFFEINTPHRMEKAKRPFSMTRKRLIRAILSANPQLDPAGIVLACRGKLLSEIRVCYGKDFQAIRCSDDLIASQCKKANLKILAIP